ncbi:MAG: 1-acyl-sn-glycerol-3-phosphate acyltransferase [Synechococcus sp.]
MPRASILTARPALRRLPTRPGRLVQQLLKRLIPLALRAQQIQVRQGNAAERLAKAFSAQQLGETTLLLAFRHPSTRDPLVLADLFWNHVPRAAQRLGYPLPRPIELRYLYDRGIPIWAGPLIGLILQRCGGIAIHRGRLDRPALKEARQVLVQGRHALVVAPEGATNNLSGEMAPLEPGVAQLAFWGVEDLAKAENSPSLALVPIGIRYSWRQQNWMALDQRLSRLEQHLALSPLGDSDDPMDPQPRQRLLRIGTVLLDALEQLERIPTQADQSFPDRLAAFRQHGLQRAELHFGLRPAGTVQERCRRIEQAAWDRIYRDNLGSLTPLQRSLADWEAREADLQLTRMRLVEHVSSVSGQYLNDNQEFDRCGELLLVVEEAVSWLEDRPIHNTPSLGPQRVELSVGDPLPVKQHLPHYQRNRREAVTAMTDQLQHALQALMEPE